MAQNYVFIITFQVFICLTVLNSWNQLFLWFLYTVLQRMLGEAGDIEPETEAMLLEYDVDESDFSEEVLSCLPDIGSEQWKIPQV